MMFSFITFFSVITFNIHGPISKSGNKYMRKISKNYKQLLSENKQHAEESYEYYEKLAKKEQE